MANKFAGNIGFIKTVETSPGIWTEEETLLYCRGDVLKKSLKWESSGNINDDLNVSNQISIVADSFTVENMSFIKFVEYMGARWKINNISVEYPRLVLTLGGLYNG